jgi:hypothetical protein
MTRCVVLFVMLLAVGTVATSAGTQNILEPSGSYSVSVHGTVTVCLNPANNYAAESCSAATVFAYPVTIAEIGTITYASGIGCETDYAEVVTPLPPANTPATVTLNGHLVAKLTYDPATGVAISAFTTYLGGSCNGAQFDSNGATETATGTSQLVVTERGKRIDALLTQVTEVPVNDITSVLLHSVDLKQTLERRSSLGWRICILHLRDQWPLLLATLDQPQSRPLQFGVF